MITLTLTDLQAQAISRDLHNRTKPVQEVLQRWLSDLADTRIRAQQKSITPSVVEALSKAPPEKRRAVFTALGIEDPDNKIWENPVRG